MPKTTNYFSNDKPKRCPKCKSAKVIPILWGEPMMPAIIEASKGKIALGGCIVTGREPEWLCYKCGTEVYPERVRAILLADKENPWLRTLRTDYTEDYWWPQGRPSGGKNSKTP